MVVPAPTSKNLPVNQEPSFIRQGESDDDASYGAPAQEAISKMDTAAKDTSANGAPKGAVVVAV